MYSKKQRLIRNNKLKNDSKSLSNQKLFSIFAGSVLVMYGVLIGDFSLNTITIPSYFIVFIGLVINLICIAIFVNQNKLNSNHG